MIEVVGRSTKFRYTVTCKNCAAILVYTKADTRTNVTMDISGTKETEYYIQCPECQEFLVVSFTPYAPPLQPARTV